LDVDLVKWNVYIRLHFRGHNWVEVMQDCNKNLIALLFIIGFMLYSLFLQGGSLDIFSMRGLLTQNENT